MDSQSAYPDSRPDAVELVETDGQWFVRIIENSRETISPGFERESFAVSFAEGQCVRLGITGFRRA